ncbi:MAG: hypothetical protein V4463_03895 [Pseudomonadota bacterium]
MKKLIALLALAGCGGSSSYQAPPATQPPLPQVDAFFAQVKTLIAALPDDLEAPSIDAMVATSPDDSEPVELN